MATTENDENTPTRFDNQRHLVDKRRLGGIEYVHIDQPKVYAQHTRSHPKRQQNKLDANLHAHGLIIPLLVDKEDVIIDGHAVLEAAKRVGFKEVPILRVTHLSSAQIKGLRLALNRIAELGEWDEEKLALEFQHLIEIDYDLELTGFDLPEIDIVIANQFVPVAASEADDLPDLDGGRVSQVGDTWLLDEHRVSCGDARDPIAYETVLQGRLAQTVITDPPYNVRIQRNVSGSGAIQHGEFVMASGEMSDEAYEAFLEAFVRNLILFTLPGSLHYLFIDWRHVHVLESVCRRYFGVPLNLCVWVKSNGGMGSFYRSRHEIVLVFRNGDAPHINNIQLARFGRNRTNVWEYDGANSPSRERRADLALHPTVKPAAMIADAIRDSSNRGDLILDPFLGSGTTIIACEQTGRVCAGLELDPHYVDVIVGRWQRFTGSEARHAATGLSFAEMSRFRNSKVLLLPAPATNKEA